MKEIKNKWMKQYGATRNQVRRILFGVEYNEALDGPEEEYEEIKIKQVKKMSDEINENCLNEIRKASEILEMDYDEAVAKYASICKVNDVDPSSQEDKEQKLGLSLWRQWFSNANMARKAAAGEGEDKPASQLPAVPGPEPEP